MFIKFQNFLIRNAVNSDAVVLCQWWNNGEIMAHAGFPNGLSTNVKNVVQKISKSDDDNRILIIEYNKTPIGEMNYRNMGNNIAEIGIKICDMSEQNKGKGKILLSMLIHSLFSEYGYKNIIVSTNMNNARARHVYEELGFEINQINYNSWTDQIGNSQSSVDYILNKSNFINFTKL